ncbi:hypothetical protein DFH08DRAFT_350245 [Mycena albidolilacea]|uniref:DUF6533 domain-containing protein n=1 Tax=Mycena albidolilacea TaxID=1033008 RepID=A0AAD6ZHH9_9AGAR|nr:hypothetical protein DFH08DRAFT_350245 [Mycena albidolilacea]
MSRMEIDDMKIARDVQLSRSLFLSGIVILLYDHLLTIGSEIQHIWVTTHKRSSIWFLIIRYFSFAGNIVMALDTFGDFGLEVCGKLRVTTGLVIVAQELIIGCTLFLRVYALYSLNRRIMYLLLCAGVVIVSVGAWSIVPVGLSPIVRTSAPGCYVPQSKTQDLRMAAAWTGELAGDILVIGLTLYRSYTQRRNGVSFAGSLGRIMIRDGVVYFGIICLVNMANILMFYFGDIYTSNSLSWFTTAISVAMISRLMLNLHVAATGEIGMVTDMEVETVRFLRRSGTDVASGGE